MSETPAELNREWLRLELIKHLIANTPHHADLHNLIEAADLYLTYITTGIRPEREKK